MAVFAALFFFGLLYRVRVALTVGDTFASDVPAPMRAMLRQGAADAMFALVAAALVLLVGQLFASLQLRRSLRRGLRRLGIGFLGLVLLDIGILCQGHHGTFFATGNGLTAQLLEESLSYAALKELTLLLTPGELVFIFVPPLLFFAFLALPRRLVRPARLFSGGLAALFVLVALFVPASPLPEALLHHPIGFVGIDLVRSRRQLPIMPSALAQGGIEVPAEAAPPPPDATSLDPKELPLQQLRAISAAAKDLPTLALRSPQYVFSETEKPPKGAFSVTRREKDAPPYNILFVLMESTGLEYAMRPIPGSGAAGEKLAMPFLRSIGEKGYLLRNHFSSGNSSPRGIFSLLSGLYVMPEVSIFDVRKDIYLPSLGSYLGERYHRFLVTPGSLDWYFPHAFLLHSGFSELWGYHALPVRKNAPGARSRARDEADTVSFFLRRLDEHAATGAPFSAVYYSFVAHWPYPDYGPETHVIHPTRPLHHYYNDLRYMDTQIERIFAHLEARKLLDHTIVVLVGDHGEAFGQHANNYTHSRMSYNENLRTPAILYQPKLFPPRVFTAPTSHVDILPTLLDALEVPYDQGLLQGESLFQPEFRRRYIFVYGNEDTLTSVSAELIKMQMSLRDGSCWVFDLKTDPDEHRRLGCQAHAAQAQALSQYRRHQQTSLRRYNQILAQAARTSH